MNVAGAYLLARMVPKPVLIVIGLVIIAADLIVERIDRRRNAKSTHRG
jgi:hypothetical protein